MNLRFVNASANSELLPPSSDYTVIDNDWIESLGLSFEERGMLIYLHSFRQDEPQSIESLAKKNGSSRKAVRAILHGLIAKGLVKAS